MNIKWFISFWCWLPFSVIGQITDKKAAPEVQIAIILDQETIFPDSLYHTYNWERFEALDIAKAEISLANIDYNLLNAGVFYYSNQYRISKKLEPFKFSKILRDASAIHSLEMINRGFFDHINSRNRKLRTPVDRTRYFRYPNDYVGENVAIEYVLENYTYSPQGEIIEFRSYLDLCKAIVDGWIKSKPHRKNLLNKNYNNLGCAVVIDRTTVSKNNLPQAFATQVFGQ